MGHTDLTNPRRQDRVSGRHSSSARHLETRAGSVQSHGLPVRNRCKAASPAHRVGSLFGTGIYGRRLTSLLIVRRIEEFRKLTASQMFNVTSKIRSSILLATALLLLLPGTAMCLICGVSGNSAEQSKQADCLACFSTGRSCCATETDGNQSTSCPNDPAERSCCVCCQPVPKNRAANNPVSPSTTLAIPESTADLRGVPKTPIGNRFIDSCQSATPVVLCVWRL